MGLCCPMTGPGKLQEGARVPPSLLPLRRVCRHLPGQPSNRVRRQGVADLCFIHQCVCPVSSMRAWPTCMHAHLPCVHLCTLQLAYAVGGGIVSVLSRLDKALEGTGVLKTLTPGATSTGPEDTEEAAASSCGAVREQLIKVSEWEGGRTADSCWSMQSVIQSPGSRVHLSRMRNILPQHSNVQEICVKECILWRISYLVHLLAYFACASSLCLSVPTVCVEQSHALGKGRISKDRISNAEGTRS